MARYNRDVRPNRDIGSQGSRPRHSQSAGKMWPAQWRSQPVYPPNEQPQTPRRANRTCSCVQRERCRRKRRVFCAAGAFVCQRQGSRGAISVEMSLAEHGQALDALRSGERSARQASRMPWHACNLADLSRCIHVLHPQGMGATHTSGYGIQGSGMPQRATIVSGCIALPRGGSAPTSSQALSRIPQRL